MEWLHPFIALTLCCGVMLTLLPESPLRRTAAMVLGLMITVCWAECIAVFLQWPSAPQITGILTETGYSAPSAQAEYAAALSAGGE